MVCLFIHPQYVKCHGVSVYPSIARQRSWCVCLAIHSTLNVMTFLFILPQHVKGHGVSVYPSTVR